VNKMLNTIIIICRINDLHVGYICAIKPINILQNNFDEKFTIMESFTLKQ